MSRCYPYRPTTGSRVRSGLGGEAALIETIKLQSEKLNLKTDLRKEQRKEKPKADIRKEQKRERKEKREEKEKNDKGYVNGGCLAKGSEDETERLEKSGITDEHNEPTQTLCYLSDGTQGSNKRKRHPSPSNGIGPSNGITVHRNIIRIRLPSQKHRLEEEEQSCSTSGRAADTFDQQKESERNKNIDVELAGPSKDAQCGARNSLLSLCKASHGNELQGKETNCEASHGNELQGKESHRKASRGNELQGRQSLYKTLIEDWVPLPLLSGVNDSDDEDWLLGTKHRTNGSKRLKGVDDVSSHQSHTSWPTAHYLPGADIYTLPYTIPF